MLLTLGGSTLPLCAMWGVGVVFGGRGVDGGEWVSIEGEGEKKRLKGVTSTRYEIWPVSSRRPHPLKKERERERTKEITQIGAETQEEENSTSFGAEVINP